MPTIFHILSIYRRLVGIQIRSQLQYRVSFILELLAIGVTLSMFFVSLALIFDRFGSLGGWTLGEVAFLWGLVELAFGTMDLLFGGFDPVVFGQRVRLGTFDQILLRPVNVTVQVLGSEFLMRRLARMAQGAAIFLFALTLVEMQWTVGKLLYLPLVLVGMIGFFGGLFIIGSTFSFWTIESIEAINILTYGGTEMMAYPFHIYGTWLRRIFTYIVPSIFLNYYPALYFLGKHDPLGLPFGVRFLSPFVGIGVLGAALLFWRFGVRHYQSTGS